jgi:hypothetical protein
MTNIIDVNLVIIIFIILTNQQHHHSYCDHRQYPQYYDHRRLRNKIIKYYSETI